MHFRVGQKVRVKKEGRVGTIDRLSEGLEGPYYIVKFEDGSEGILGGWSSLANIERVTREPKFTKDSIVKVYSGKPGCSCGCRGKHSNKPASITRVFKEYKRLLSDHPDLIKEQHNELNQLEFVYFNNEENTRQYAIYFFED